MDRGVRRTRRSPLGLSKGYGAGTADEVPRVFNVASAVKEVLGFISVLRGETVNRSVVVKRIVVREVAIGDLTIVCDITTLELSAFHRVSTADAPVAHKVTTADSPAQSIELKSRQADS